MRILTVFLLLCSIIQDAYQSLQCKSQLGMSNRAIPDSSITASSSLSERLGPDSARARAEVNEGAWCPTKPATSTSYEYLQIDLGSLHIITIVETQGRFGRGQGRQYASYYRLEYQREPNDHWRQYKMFSGEIMIKGNDSPYGSALRELKPPLIGRAIRIVPYATLSNEMLPKEIKHEVCLRVELYGCPSPDNLLEYRMRDGNTRGDPTEGIRFIDQTYDGEKLPNGSLSGGLGQLHDGVLGEKKFRSISYDKKGFSWVGWRNDSSSIPPVQILFRFDGVFRFNSVRLHTSNWYSQDIRVFRRAKFFFNIGGRYFMEPPVVFDFVRDTFQKPRQIQIPLEGQIGRYVKMILYFDSKWIMLSEVLFDNVKLNGTFEDELPPGVTDKRRGRGVGDRTGSNSMATVDPSGSNEGTNIGASDLSISSKSSPSGESGNYIIIIIAVIAAFLLVVLILFGVLLCRHRRRRARSTLSTKEQQMREVFGSGDDVMPANFNDLRAVFNGRFSNGRLYSTVSTNGDCSGSSLSSREVHGTVAAAAAENGTGAVLVNGSDRPFATPDIQTFKPALTQKGTNGHGLPYMTYTPDLTRSTPRASPHPVNIPMPGQLNGSATLLPMAMTGIPAAASVNPTPAQQTLSAAQRNRTLTASPTVSPYQERRPSTTVARWSASDPNATPNPALYGIQGPAGNNAMLCLLPDEEMGEPQSISYIDRGLLRSEPKIISSSNTRFGKIEVNNLLMCQKRPKLGASPGTLDRHKTAGYLIRVAIRSVNEDDPDSLEKLADEAQTLSFIRNENICQMIGVCIEDQQIVAIITEHANINLYSLLSESSESFSIGCLLHFASQLANGCAHLDLLGIVHRDIACRNLLILHNNRQRIPLLKLSDLAICCSEFGTHYCEVNDCKLPIRWMATESLVLETYSNKTDVWSFGVTLWELFTHCHSLPFTNLTDSDVANQLQNVDASRKSFLQDFLPPPESCPKEIYNLMCECWNIRDSDRPCLYDIRMFLERNNQGYNPSGDEHLKQILSSIDSGPTSTYV